VFYFVSTPKHKKRLRLGHKSARQLKQFSVYQDFITQINLWDWKLELISGAKR
jgi:hypothetical protein